MIQSTYFPHLYINQAVAKTPTAGGRDDRLGLWQLVSAHLRQPPGGESPGLLGMKKGTSKVGNTFGTYDKVWIVGQQKKNWASTEANNINESTWRCSRERSMT